MIADLLELLKCYGMTFTLRSNGSWYLCGESGEHISSGDLEDLLEYIDSIGNEKCRDSKVPRRGDLDDSTT